MPTRPAIVGRGFLVEMVDLASLASSASPVAARIAVWAMVFVAIWISTMAAGFGRASAHAFFSLVSMDS